MKKYTLIIACVAATLSSCVQIDPNWSPQQKAQARRQNQATAAAAGTFAGALLEEFSGSRRGRYGYGHRYGHGYGYGVPIPVPVYGYNPFFGY
jgi:hypothetical protein